MDNNLSIVVCALNEAAHVGEVLCRLVKAYPHAQLILVDNGSTDGTADVAKAAVPSVEVVTEPVPGKGTAMRAGARQANREWLLFHDADLEYDIEDSVRVVQKAIAHDCSCAGTRMVAYDRILASSWLANRLIQALLRMKTGAHVPDVLTGTRCMRTSLFLALETQSAHFGIETEITRAILDRTVTLLSEPVRFYPRSVEAGKKIRLRHLFSLMHQAVKS